MAVLPLWRQQPRTTLRLAPKQKQMQQQQQPQGQDKSPFNKTPPQNAENSQHRIMESSSSSSLLLDSTMKSSSGGNNHDHDDDSIIYVLSKKHDGCTGMFWRPDPFDSIPSVRLKDNKQDWPRDGAWLKGKVRTLSDGTLWLAATHVKNLFDTDWKNAPEGAYLPFEYDNHYFLQILDKEK